MRQTLLLPTTHNVRIVPHLLAGLLLTCSAQAAQPNLNSGEWEYEMQLSMPGSTFVMPPMRFRSCVDRNNPAPQDPGQGNASKNDCKVLEQRVQGNKLTWHVRCEGRDGVSDTRGEGVYQGNSFNGTMTTTSIRQGGSMAARMSGKRVGPCTQPK